MTPAARGAAWLDQVRPGWYTAIDTARLDLDHAQNCILGQSIGWFTGCKMLERQHGVADIIKYGFIGTSACVEQDWIAEIDRRSTPTFYVAAETPPTSRKCVPPRRRRLLHRRTSHNRSAVGSLQ